jgi:hypothetical protein
MKKMIRRGFLPGRSAAKLRQRRLYFVIGGKTFAGPAAILVLRLHFRHSIFTVEASNSRALSDS